jgi:hypothetical protein
MQVIITKVKTVDIDLDAERKKIKKGFNKKSERVYRDKLIEVIDIFERDGFNMACDAYDELPYNEVDEYPLQESMGIWWWQIINDQSFNYHDNVKHQYKMEIIK